MPQLDSVAYVSEVVWLVFGFLVLYFLLLNSGLPTLHKVLKLRRIILEKSKDSIINVKKENVCVELLFKQMGLSVSQEIRSVFDGLLKQLDLYLLNVSRFAKVSILKLRSDDFVEKIVKENFGKYKAYTLVNKIDYIKEKKNINNKIL